MFAFSSGQTKGSGAELVGKLIARKRYHRAAEELRAQIERDPGSVPLRIRLADVLLLEGNAGEALSILQSLVEELAAAGDDEKAIVVIRKIQRIVPGHPVYHEMLATLLARRDETHYRQSRRPSTRRRQPESRAPEVDAVGTGWTMSEVGMLRASHLFRDLSLREVADLLRELPARPFEPGQVVITEGEPGDSVWVVVAGAVRVWVRNTDSENALVRTLQQGDYFGEISVLTGQPRTATVIAATDCRLLELDRGHLEDLGQRHPRIATVLRETFRKRALSREEVRARGGIDDML